MEFDSDLARKTRASRRSLRWQRAANGCSRPISPSPRCWTCRRRRTRLRVEAGPPV